jgi:hypothetical protein
MCCRARKCTWMACFVFPDNISNVQHGYHLLLVFMARIWYLAVSEQYMILNFYFYSVYLVWSPTGNIISSREVVMPLSLYLAAAFYIHSCNRSIYYELQEVVQRTGTSRSCNRPYHKITGNILHSDVPSSCMACIFWSIFTTLLIFIG